MNKKILIVDDEEEIGNLLGKRFEKEGFDTFAVTGVLDALKVLENHRIDLLISDIRMPDHDGVDLLKKISKMNSDDQPVFFFVSGYFDYELFDLYSLGAKVCFMKPFDFSDILSAARRFLNENENNRKFVRDDVKETVEVFIKTANTSIRRLSNISEGGMFIESAGELPLMDEKVSFEAEIFENYGVTIPFVGEGVVRWIRKTAEEGFPRGFGIEFNKLSQESKKSLYVAVNRYRTKTYLRFPDQ